METLFVIAMCSLFSYCVAKFLFVLDGKEKF